MTACYAWAGGAELLHPTPGGGPGAGRGSVIAALPPFEEANRTRALVATLLRDLDARGFATALPDLPGQGESLTATADATLADWRAAFAAAAAALPAPVYALSVRAGALVDGAAAVAGRWRLSPQDGAALARELARLTDGDGLVAGNRVAPALLAEVAAAAPAGGPARVVRLASARAPADRVVDAAPPWRRAEPDNDPALAALLAADVAAWIAGLAAAPAGPPPAPSARPAPVAAAATARTLVAIPCAGETLAGTLDPAPGATGLLIVSGGNEIRTGAVRGMATLAQRVAAAGHPVLRFDRRGVGDSTGANAGFAQSGPDIAAAAARFRALQPQLARIVGFGNCDAATALALFGPAAGIDALVLANPWTIEDAAAAGAGDLPPPAAIRARYAAKLRDPRELLRLVSGGVDLRKLWRGLRRARAAPPAGLAQRLAAALPAGATVLTARGDNTAIAFRAALPRVAVCERDTDSHAFARPGDADWLFAQVTAALAAR